MEAAGLDRRCSIPRPIVPGDSVALGGVSVQTFDQDHGYTHSLGLRLGGLGYSTDAVRLDEAAFATLAGVDTWIVGCFQRTEHITHAWVDRVLEWVERVRPRRTVLTHMGPDMDWAWLKAHLPPGVEPAYDGMTIEV